MAKETTVARTPEDLQRRYRFKNIEITKQELDSFLDDLVFDSSLSSTSTNPVQNKIITIALANKVTAVSGKGLSTNDFTDANKHVLDQITDAKIQQWNNNSFSIDSVYPVGSIYMSVNNTDPSVLFGGTWEQIQDTFLLSAGSTYVAGTTGGEANHTLTIDEMPSHTHNFIDGSDNRTNVIATFVAGGSNDAAQTGGSRKYESEYIDYTGGSQPFNNMPPYLVVYMWQRIA